MGSPTNNLRTLILRFHATEAELAAVQTDLEVFVDRLVFDDMGLSGRTINLIRMLKGQIGVARGYVSQNDYEEAVVDLRLDSDATNW